MHPTPSLSTLLKCLSLAAWGALMFPLSAGAADLKTEGYAGCESWLGTHYRQHERIELVEEYVKNGVYNLVANFAVTTSLGARTVIGFECQYFSDQSRTVGVPSLTPFQRPSPKSRAVLDMKEYRVDFGFHVCPTTAPWRKMADQIIERDRQQRLALKRGFNLSGTEMSAMVSDLPPSCDWVSAGTIVYGPPIKKEVYKEWSYIQIRMRDGRLVWTEDGNLE